MDATDHTTYREWIDLDADGALGATERQRLEAHLGACGDCRSERQALGRLGAMFTDGRVPVREGFRSQVLAALPAAGWEARNRRSWLLPLAVAAVLAAVAVGLGVLGSSPLGPAGSLLGALDAVAGLAAAGALAGAGLLAASWKGVGLVTLEAVGATPGGLVAFVVLVICLNLLLLSLLRRRRTAAAGEPVAGDPRR